MCSERALAIIEAKETIPQNILMRVMASGRYDAAPCLSLNLSGESGPAFLARCCERNTLAGLTSNENGVLSGPNAPARDAKFG